MALEKTREKDLHLIGVALTTGKSGTWVGI